MIGMTLGMCAVCVIGFLSGALTRSHTALRWVFCRCGVTRVCPLGHDDSTAHATGPGVSQGAGAGSR